MKGKLLHQPFDIYISGLEDWKENVLTYHFFEIVQIREGEGVREVNKNFFPYAAGDIFLFTPLDCRGFQSRVPTKFYSIRFSEIFLTACKSEAERETILLWLKGLEQLFYQHNRSERFAVKDTRDHKMVTGLINNLVSEYTGKPSYFEENIVHLITLILNTLVRNIASLPPAHKASGEEPLINKILLHLKKHVQSKEKLSVRYLAREFHLSPNYVGEYFKKMTGESLQRFITLYKMQLVENKLRFSQLSLSQIADDLGFTDESHLSRQFKKYHGDSPAQFRKSLQ